MNERMFPRHEIDVRLRRIEGQLAGVRRMYGDGRSSFDLFDQLKAIKEGLAIVSFMILEDEIRNHARDVEDVGEPDDVISLIVHAVRRCAM